MRCTVKGVEEEELLWRVDRRPLGLVGEHNMQARVSATAWHMRSSALGSWRAAARMAVLESMLERTEEMSEVLRACKWRGKRRGAAERWL